MRRGFALLLALTLLLSGCGGPERADQGPLLYYAVQDSADYGASALQGEPWTEGPEVPGVEDYVTKLLQAPQDPRLETVFPKGLRLLDWELENGVLCLDFSEEYSELTVIGLTLANGCLTLTLTQLEGVEQVAVTVEGRALPEGGGPLSAEDLLLVGEAADPVTLGFQLYFPLANGTGLGTEYRRAELSGARLSDQINAVLLLLVQGPSKPDEMAAPFDGLESQLDSQLVDGVCLLTLTEGWTQVLEGDALALQALVNSLCELDGVTALAFDGTGETDLSGVYEAMYE